MGTPLHASRANPPPPQTTSGHPLTSYLAAPNQTPSKIYSKKGPTEIIEK